MQAINLHRNYLPTTKLMKSSNNAFTQIHWTDKYICDTIKYSSSPGQSLDWYKKDRITAKDPNPTAFSVLNPQQVECGHICPHFTVLYSTVQYCTVLYCTVLYCTVLYCTLMDFSSTDMWKVLWKSQGPVMIKSILNNLFKIRSLLNLLLIYRNFPAGWWSWRQDKVFQNFLKWKFMKLSNIFFGWISSGCIPHHVSGHWGLTWVRYRPVEAEGIYGRCHPVPLFWDPAKMMVKEK